MARSGSFSKGGVAYGQALSVVHPPDNSSLPQWDPALNDASLNLSDAQRQELQDRIDDLTNTLRGERSF